VSVIRKKGSSNVHSEPLWRMFKKSLQIEVETYIDGWICPASLSERQEVNGSGINYNAQVLC